MIIDYVSFVEVISYAILVALAFGFFLAILKVLF